MNPKEALEHYAQWMGNSDCPKCCEATAIMHALISHPRTVAEIREEVEHRIKDHLTNKAKLKGQDKIISAAYESDRANEYLHLLAFIDGEAK